MMIVHFLSLAQVHKQSIFSEIYLSQSLSFTSFDAIELALEFVSILLAESGQLIMKSTTVS